MTQIRALFFDMDQTSPEIVKVPDYLFNGYSLIQQRCPHLNPEEIYHRYRAINNVHWEDSRRISIAQMIDAIEARSHIWNEFLQSCGVNDLDFARTVADIFQEAREGPIACMMIPFPFLKN